MFCVSLKVAFVLILFNNTSDEQLPQSLPCLLPAATKLGLGNVFTGVCDSANRWGVYLSACWDTHTTPLTRHPLGPDLPSEQTPPWDQTPPGSDTPQSRPPPRSRLRHTVNEQPVHILLECILVDLLFTRHCQNRIFCTT